MKKRGFSVLLPLLLIPILVIGAFSLPASADNLPRVVDNAGLLTESERAALASKIADIAEDWGMDVVVLTENGIGAKSVEAHADDFFDYEGYGLNSGRDGILFLVDMDSRQFHYSTSGYGITVFTDYGLEYIDGEVTPYLSDGDFYGAFTEYIGLADDFLREASENEPYDIWNPVDGGSYEPDPDPYEPDPYDPDYKYTALDAIYDAIQYHAEALLVIAALSVLIALVTVLIMRGKMNTARPQPYASSYIKNGLELTLAQDIFLYSTTTRTRRAESSSGGGGSSTHRSSSGSSHGGRSGRF